MSDNENHDNILNDEIIETKPITKRYKPRDPNYNTHYYHTVEWSKCGCVVVNRALYNHKKTAKCKVVKHFTDIAQTEYNVIKRLQDIMTS